MSALTVIIPCKNEQVNIDRCIASVEAIADEVLVADSGSTDDTLARARRWSKCRIIEREYVHSGDFKNWAIPQARHPWVLLLDADERVTVELADEIRTTLRSPAHDGYWIYRNNHFMGHRIRFGAWRNDRVLRLFRRDLSRYVGDTDHAEVSVTGGRVSKLRARLEHYTYWNYDQYLRKLERYTTHQARVWQAAGKRSRPLRLLGTIPLRFLHTYLVRGGFLDGLPGFQLSVMIAYYSFLKQARLWELQHAIPQSVLEPPLDEVQPGQDRKIAAA